MKRWWCVLVFCLFASGFPRIASGNGFDLPSPSSILRVASETRAPQVHAAVPLTPPAAPGRLSGPDTDSGLFDSAPDWNLTPGVLCTPADEDFQEYRYPEQIPYCRRNTSIADKKEVSRWYGVRWEDHHLYQYDHLLSLCLGGSNDLRNLWPMPYADARSKAKLESALCWRLRKGEITQAAAIEEELGWFSENAPQMLPYLRKAISLKKKILGPA
jgi:hypothetical protein